MVLIGLMSGHDAHDTGPRHPERAARLDAVARGIDAADLGEAAAPLEGRPAERPELARVHREAYLRRLERLSGAGGGALDPDTEMSRGSWATACWAAGLGLSAAEALDRGAAAAAFVATRPPGHHAGSDRAMGFCLINNLAVTAAALAERGERVLIFDWDVHHGNGTQEIFWNDPRVLYASTHQWPLYPGTGSASDTGGPGAPGLTINVPLPAGATGDVALAAVDEILAPAADAFGPTWVLVSAGFDAHRDDPLAELAWSAGDYALLAARMSSLAPRPGRLIAFLEGGYDLEALACSAGATVAALAGAPRPTEPPTVGGPGREIVAGLVRRRAQWEPGA